jgi:HlyD family secretion protein
MQKRPPIAVIVILLAVIGIAAYFIIAESRKNTTSALAASGTVETTEINIAPELAGKVLEVKVSEGDSVKKGDILFQLDDALLKAQRNVAAAALDTAKSSTQTADSTVASAQAQYDLVLNNTEAQAQPARSTAWKTPAPADFNQPLWYYTQSEQLDAAQTQVDAGASALTKAQDDLTFVEQKSTSADFIKAEKRLIDARAAFQVAQDVLDRTNGASDGQDLKDAAQKNYDDAKQELDDAQVGYDDAMTTEGAKDVLTARAERAVAQETYDSAKDRVRGLQTGVYSLSLESAAKQLDQAKTAAQQAHVAVNQAQANLDLIDTQMAKLTISSPQDAVVLTRLIEPGEVLNPGSLAFTLGLLSDLTITVYIPEDRYGEISLGQPANVNADSFPGKIFSASVVNISDKAEFTPRNVQTVEGRSSTVYAIKLKVNDPDGNLKPGMPADVTFK